MNACKLGLAGGILWGLSIFVMTLISMETGYGEAYFAMLEGLLPGYSVSYAGSLIGLVYGFADMFIFLFLLAWLYNKFDKAKG